MNKYFYKVACEHFGFGLALSVNVVWQLSRGLTLGQASLIEAIALATRMVLDVPTGHLSDHLGRKPVLVGASLFFALGYGVMSKAHSFAAFLIAALALALGFSFMSGSEEALMFEIQSKNYRHALSNMTVVDEGATIVGLLVSALVVKLFGIQASIALAAVAMFLTVIVGLVVITEPRHQRLLSSAKLSLSEIASRSKRIFKTHLPLLAISLCLAVYYEGGRVLWQPRLTEAGLAVQYLGIAFALFKGASLLGAYLARRQHHSDAGRELTWIGLLLALALALMAAAPLWAVIFGFAFYFCLENVYRIAQSQYFQQMAGEGNRATVLSVASFVRSGYSIVTLPILGFISQGGHTRYGFLLLLTLQAIAAIILIPLSKKNPICLAGLNQPSSHSSKRARSSSTSDSSFEISFVFNSPPVWNKYCLPSQELCGFAKPQDSHPFSAN